MPSNKIKGITVEIGGDTTKLGKALQDVEKRSRSLSGELGQINKLLKLDPGNTDLLAQKQQVLAQAIETTSKKLEALRSASEHAAKTSANYDAWKKKMDPLQASIEDTSQKLKEMQEAAESAKEDFGVDSEEYKAASKTVSELRQQLKDLKQQVKEVNEEFDNPVSAEQARELQRAIVATEVKLNSYQKAAQETADQLQRVGTESSDAARGAGQVEQKSGQAAQKLDDMGDQAKQTGKETEDMSDAADRAAKAGLTALAAAATAAMGSLVACAEQSREYRTEMSKLTTAYEQNGFSASAAQDAYEDLQGILGETDQAVEAANHLAKLTDNEQELATWTGDILPGVFATFGASLPLEGLTESANETARVGQITGSLADAINWAADAGETFGVVLRENTEENQAWNDAVNEAASAEDYFNLALQECSSEQERQQLITETLTKLYKGAATQYKKTNAEVIRSNEATEKWNQATAKIGEIVEPVITDVKELGAELLEGLVPNVEDLVDGSDDLTDRLRKISAWVKTNMPTIKASIVGVAGALVTYKTATIAAEVAQKGLKTAIMASEVATKALALAQAATPWGLVAVAIGGVLTALIAYDTMTQDVQKSTSALTEEQQKQVEASKKAAEEFQEMQLASQEAADSTLMQMDRVSALVNELQTLADESGNVQQADQDRAQYILGELNEALGTEYTMTGNQIDRYGELTDSVYAAIDAKKAEALLEAYNDDWITALEEEQAAFERIALSNKDYQAQISTVTELQQQLSAVEQECTEARMNAQNATDESYRTFWANRAAELENSRADLSNQLTTETEILAQKKAALDQAEIDYGSYQQQILNYEAAETAAMQGNYDTAIQLLNNKGEAYSLFADDVDEQTARVLETLYKEAVDTGIAAEDTKAKFEAGIGTFTFAMVDEAQKGYQEAMDKFATAYADAYAIGGDIGNGLDRGIAGSYEQVFDTARGLVSGTVGGSGVMRDEAASNSPSRKTIALGEDIGEGLRVGMENKRSALYTKATSLVSGIISKFRQAADSHSPSRKMIDFGEDLGEGTRIGLEEQTKPLLQTAEDQIQQIMAVFRDTDLNAQRSFNATQRSAIATDAVQRQQLRGIEQGNRTMLQRLDSIISAIEAGHVILLDGKTLVGKTAAEMDAALGKRRVMTDRGTR